MSRFVHLHTHTHYSLLSALPQVPDLVKQAKKLGMEALAITDNGNMYGAIEFYKECKKKEIKPIFGVDFFLASRTRFDKEPSVDERRFRIVLLAENIAGYKNLIKLVTASNMEGFFHRPRIDHELLERYHEGLLAIIPAFNGETSGPLRTRDLERAGERLDWYKKIFGEKNVYLEITHHPEIENHEELVEEIKKFGSETNTPLVATNDVHYLHFEDKKAREVVLTIQNTTERDGGDEAGDFSFLSPKQMEEYFADTKEALENTIKIADRCTVELELGTWTFPNLILPSGKSYEQELRDLTYQGIEKHGLEKTDEIEKRIEYELNIIKLKGFAPYFLVVADLLHFAHNHGILTTIRGSVAGSLVTYLAGITNINPLAYKLPFERFLNPERPGAPDIDMDYADNRRDEMHEYARQKYGRDRVAQIGTFGTMMARGAVRDVARAMGYPYGVGDRISKLIPMGSQGFPMTIKHALEITPELKEIYKKEDDVKEILDMAQKIEGNARHISIHAAGVVISNKPLSEVVPVQYDPKEGTKIITQYDMWSVEDVGLLKFDFLGIRNLAILSDAIRLVKLFDDIKVDIENIPLDDPKTFELLSKGETIGLFQLNGSGMTRYLKELKPSSIHDINAMVALYRPGPLESIPSYVERKHDASKVTYLDPRLKDILDQSYGVITYQDDVLLISIHLAGYSWLEADKLRKAMGKKIPEVMQAEKEKLIKGFIEFGKLAPAKAQKLWELIEPFASYGFNKAHAASYGKVAYQTAYMKANFTGEYMTAVLTAESGDVEEVATIIKECTRLGIPVLAPDINESFKDFTLIRSLEDNDRIRFGLSSIKNFGEGIAEAIIEERKAHGKFISLSDFLSRVQNRNLNKKSLEALIYSGSLDSFGERGELLANTEAILAFNRDSKKEVAQNSLFGSESMKGTITLVPAPPLDKEDMLKWEKELLGLYVSGHPLDKYKNKLEGKTISIERIKGSMQDGMVAVAHGIVEEAKPLLTKKGERMYFLKLTDYSGSLEVVVFPRTYTESKDKLILDNCIAIKGKVSHRNGTVSLIAEAVKVL